jgi:hypothetical protein
MSSLPLTLERGLTSMQRFDVLRRTRKGRAFGIRCVPPQQRDSI